MPRSSTTIIHQMHKSWEACLGRYENTFRFHQHPLKLAQQDPALGEGAGLMALVCMLDQTDSEDTLTLLPSSQI